MFRVLSPMKKREFVLLMLLAGAAVWMMPEGPSVEQKGIEIASAK